VPLLGSLEELTAERLAAAPQCVTEGVFNAFRPAGGLWVALPAWAKLATLPGLVALQVNDTRQLTAIPSLASSPGPCLLLVERCSAGAPTTPLRAHYYVVQRSSSLLLDARGGKALQRLEVMSGSDAAGGGGGGKVTVLGRLVLACRPPLPSGTPKEMKEGVKDLGDADDDDEDDDVDGCGIPASEDE